MSSEIDPEAYDERLGTTETWEYGILTRRDARRYARSVEDENPLFHDVDYAREHGYDDIVVPPNFLSAIIDPTDGCPASELREDGLDPNQFPIDMPSEAILMGGGQDLTIDQYATAKSTLTIEKTFCDIYQRDSASMGVLTFVEQNSEYFVDEDERVLRCEATMIVGDRQ
jgi:acyl dehydratase